LLAMLEADELVRFARSALPMLRDSGSNRELTDAELAARWRALATTYRAKGRLAMAAWLEALVAELERPSAGPPAPRSTA